MSSAYQGVDQVERLGDAVKEPRRDPLGDHDHVEVAQPVGRASGRRAEQQDPYRPHRLEALDGLLKLTPGLHVGIRTLPSHVGSMLSDRSPRLGKTECDQGLLAAARRSGLAVVPVR